MVHKALAFIFGLWILQGLMSYGQIVHYRKTLTQLKTKGKVFIGQEKGKLKPGSIVLLVVDGSNKIIDVQEMKGISVFDRFRKKEKYIGKSLEELVEELNQLKKETVTTKAMKKALKDFSLT
jgi:glucitol operon activator protein